MLTVMMIVLLCLSIFSTLIVPLKAPSSDKQKALLKTIEIWARKKAYYYEQARWMFCPEEVISSLADRYWNTLETLAQDWADAVEDELGLPDSIEDMINVFVIPALNELGDAALEQLVYDPQYPEFSLLQDGFEIITEGVPGINYVLPPRVVYLVKNAADDIVDIIDSGRAAINMLHAYNDEINIHPGRIDSGFNDLEAVSEDQADASLQAYNAQINPVEVSVRLQSELPIIKRTAGNIKILVENGATWGFTSEDRRAFRSYYETLAQLDSYAMALLDSLPSFSVAVDPSTLTVLQDNYVQTQVNLASCASEGLPDDFFSGTVDLRIEWPGGRPDWVTIHGEGPVSMTPEQSWNIALVFDVSANAPPNTYRVKLIATCGSFGKSVEITLLVKKLESTNVYKCNWNYIMLDGTNSIYREYYYEYTVDFKYSAGMPRVTTDVWKDSTKLASDVLMRNGYIRYYDSNQELLVYTPWASADSTNAYVWYYVGDNHNHIVPIGEMSYSSEVTVPTDDVWVGIFSVTVPTLASKNYELDLPIMPAGWEKDFRFPERTNGGTLLRGFETPPDLPFGTETVIGTMTRLDYIDDERWAFVFPIKVNVIPPAKYTVTIDPNGGKIYVDGSPITSPTSYSWYKDTTHTLDPVSYIPSDGTKLLFSRWNDESTTDPRTIIVTSSATLKAYWNVKHRLTIFVDPVGAGTTTPSSGSYWYDSGTSVIVSETPSPGYLFSYWDLDGNSAGTATSVHVAMTAPHDLTAVFINVETTILIADWFRVLKVNTRTGIVWEVATVAGASSAQQLPNGNILFGHALDSNVTEVDSQGRIVWEMELSWTSLNDAHHAQRLPNGNTIVAQWFDGRIVEINMSGDTVWDYTVDTPEDVDWLSNDNLLIASWNGDNVIEVNRMGETVWSYSSGPYVSDADRLPNGNTLIVKDVEGRLVEVDNQGKIVWEVTGLSRISDAERLDSGLTFVTEPWNDRVMLLDYNGNIVWQFTGLNHPVDVEILQPTLQVTSESPVNILVTDPNGLQVGYDRITQSVVNEIVGAYYSGPGTEPQVIVVPYPSPGVYVINTFGTDAGTYRITMQSVGVDGFLINTETWSGTTAPQESDRYIVRLLDDGSLTSPQRPQLWSSDSLCNPKDVFVPGEPVYATVQGVWGQTVTLYVVVDQTAWNDGDSLVDVSDGAETLTLNSDGGTQAIQIWAPPLVLGEYDVVMDVDNDGVYDTELDAVDSILIPGFNVIPEIPFGTIMASAAMMIALVAYVAVPKLRRKQEYCNP